MDQSNHNFFQIQQFRAFIGITTHSKDVDRARSTAIPAIIRPLTFAIDAPRQQTLHSVAIYNGGVRLNEAHNLKYNISYQFNNRKEFDVRRSGRTDIPAVNMNLHTLEMDLTEDNR